MRTLTDDEKKIIRVALDAHKDDVKRLMKNAEKLGLKAVEQLKLTFIAIDVLQADLIEDKVR